MNAPLTLLSRVEVYLAQRRRMGFTLHIEGEQLMRFAHFAEQIGHQGPLTIKLAAQWAASSHQNRPLTAARRIEVIRPFARFCQQFDPNTEIPPRGLCGRAHRRLTPHIFTDTEIGTLMTACAVLHPAGGLRGVTCAALFGLIAATGLRISEATGLTRTDVDLERGVLHIRHAKFGKSRWVPLHVTATQALAEYAQRRDDDPRSAVVDAFFVFDGGQPATRSRVEYAFKLLRNHLQWHARGGHPVPRIHDLRHTFACRRLELWHTQGLEIDRNMLALSTYLGHSKVTDTYWYATATPELLAKAASLYSGCAGGGAS